jgi:hypothetical protein
VHGKEIKGLIAWRAVGDDMADKDRAQGKSKKAMTKKAKQKKKKDATPIVAGR